MTNCGMTSYDLFERTAAAVTNFVLLCLGKALYYELAKHHLIKFVLLTKEETAGTQNMPQTIRYIYCLFHFYYL